VTFHLADLEPSAIAERTYRTRRPLSYIDSTTMLVLLVCTLMLLPSRLVVPGLTDFGRPAVMVSMLLVAWWLAARLHPRLTMTGPQPIRWAVLVYTASVLASYAAGYLRGLPSLEASGADAALIGTAAFVGVILMAADGVANRDRLDTVIRVLVWCAGVMALIGFGQLILNIDITQYMIPPGMDLHSELVGFRARGDGFFQIASTATHYIEFSAVMAVALPFAIHVARFAGTPGRRQVAWGCAMLTAASVPVTLSRTGMLALVVGMAVMFTVWSWRIRYNAMLAGAGLMAAFLVVQPGLLGTIRSTFIYLDEDPSIQGRLDDYPIVQEHFSQQPWFGRGVGTFVPELHLVLDNQWLGTLVTSGMFGVAALAGLHLTAISLAIISYRRASNAADRHLCAALVSTQMIAIAVGFTFDSLGFGTYATMVALLTGLAGAMWRLTHPARQVRTSTASGTPAPTR
jgi:hypothetical protein